MKFLRKIWAALTGKSVLAIVTPVCEHCDSPRLRQLFQSTRVVCQDCGVLQTVHREPYVCPYCHSDDTELLGECLNTRECHECGEYFRS